MKTTSLLGLIVFPVIITFLAESAQPISVSAQSTASEGDLGKQLSVIETNLTLLVSDMDMVAANPLAKGIVIMWSGSVSSVPEGWALCNGSNGTPDLRNRFVMGTTVSGDVRQEGGSSNHTHSLAGHQHPVRVPAHSHPVPTVENIPTAPGGQHAHTTGPATGAAFVHNSGFGGEGLASDGHLHAIWTNETAHKHQLEIPAHGTVGTDTSASTSLEDSRAERTDNLPPYYSLCFLMKLPEKKTEGWKPESSLDSESRLLRIGQTVNQMNAEVKTALSNLPPEGLITLWSGELDAVPLTWQVCNGAGGIPDLRNRFVMGAAGSSAVGETGGSINHEHSTHAHVHEMTLPPHHHVLPSVTLATQPGGEHRHGMENSLGFSTLSTLGDDGDEKGARSSHNHTASTGVAHSHRFTLAARATEDEDGEGWTGLVDSRLLISQHLPPYINLGYIMKRDKAAGSVSLSLPPSTSSLSTRIDSMEKNLTNLTTIVSTALASSVPEGAIALWAGGYNTVPGGWSVCDGRYGTPDLRNRFVMGAAREPGETGGSLDHNHALGSHHHTAYLAHNHQNPSREYQTRTLHSSGPTGAEFDTSHMHPISMGLATVNGKLTGSIAFSTTWHEHSLSGETAHEHGVTIDQPLTAATRDLQSITSDETYASYSTNHLPSLHKLLYVMKTGITNLPPALVQAPNSLRVGDALSFRWSTSNLASNVAEGTRLGRIYLSTDPLYSPYSDRYLGDVVYSKNLVSNGVFSVNSSLTVPNTPPGNYFVVFYIENSKLIGDTNQFRSAPIEVKTPDLNPVQLQSETVVDAGQSLEASWTVVNQGGAQANAPWNDRLFLSSTPVFNASSYRFLGDVVHEQILGAKSNYTARLKFNMPNVPPGTYYLIVQVDHYNRVYEAEGGNQYRSTPIQVRAPDLRPIALEVPLVVEAGQSFNASWSVSNLGNGEARPSWVDRFYLSTSPVYSSLTARYVGGLTVGQALAAGASYATNLAIAMPNVQPGIYYLLVQVDHYDNVYESLESNQFRSITIQVLAPDLAPASLSASPTAVVGRSLRVNWIMSNGGAAPAKPAWNDRLYLSSDSEYSSGTDLYLGQVLHGQALAPGDRYATNLTVTVPKVAAGDYYLVLQADHYDAVFEGNENNNYKYLPVKISATAPLPIALLPGVNVSQPIQINLDPPASAQRTELSLNGRLLGTLYGQMAGSKLSQSLLLPNDLVIQGANILAGNMFDNSNRLVSSAESLWEDWERSMETRVRIDEPNGSKILTDGLTAGPGTMLIRAYVAGKHLFSRPNPAGPGWINGEEWIPFSGGYGRVEFYVDSVLVHTSTNGVPTDPCYHEHEYNLSGSSLGEHRVRVRLAPPEGYRPASDSATFEVEQRRADLQVTRSVVAISNYFDVSLTISNRGTRAATLSWLKEPMKGFQPCQLQSSFATTDVKWNYQADERQGNFEISFDANLLPAHGTTGIRYKAVPILYKSDVEYRFGGSEGGMEYVDAAGVTTTENDIVSTTRTSPYAARRSLADAVAEACRQSDYLLITDPSNLKNAFRNSGMRNVLTNMAELATARNGVLGYYHTIGSIHTPYTAGNFAGAGRLFREHETKEQIFIGEVNNDQISCWSPSQQQTIKTNQLPIPIDLRAGDGMAVGNVFLTSHLSTNRHDKDEIVVAWGDSEHGLENVGRIFIYQYEYRTNDQFSVLEPVYLAGPDPFFQSGDKLVLGAVKLDPEYPAKDLVIARSNGTIDVYQAGGWFVTSCESQHRAEDFFATGNLLGPSERVEMVVGDVSWSQIKIYADTSASGTGDPAYEEAYQINLILRAEDGLAVGDVLGDSYDEIVVADASEGRITIYGYNPALDHFEAVSDFALDFQAGDKLACAYFDSIEKKEILVFRGHSVEGRQEGTVEIINCSDGERPGDRWALDGLINDGGRWATAMTNHWSSEGYLLIVGENEIIPTFTKSWDIDDFEGNGGQVDYTDRIYASTGVDENSSTPELSVGRMVGNSDERLVQALKSAIELAREPWRLSNQHAYCASGPDPDHADRFIPLRESIADKLSSRGFSVIEQHLPTDTDFFSHDANQDVIFLAGHGNTTVWGSCLNWSNVFYHFDPGSSRPLVYAMSCLTGRYPDYADTMSEEFLWNHASGYIGATENTYNWGHRGRGWGNRLAEAFFDRIASQRPVGLSLKLAKRHRLSDAANTYSSDWNKNRYHCAIYHLYGDPKASFQWAAEARPAAYTGLANSPALPTLITGPLSQWTMVVPHYLVETNQGSHEIFIPGGEIMTETGQPAVPFYTAEISFPKGAVVQEVDLIEKSGLVTMMGLRLPPVQPYLDSPGLSSPQTTVAPQGWWPDRDFEWSMSENRDGSRTLAIKAFAFAYNSTTTEARFYGNYVFGIRWTPSTVDITQLLTDRAVYAPKAMVKASLEVSQSATQPIDLVAHPTILVNENRVVEKLSPIPMPSLKTLGWVQIQWNPTNQLAGDYILEVVIRDLAGNELDRAQTEFQIGGVAGAMAGFDIDPRSYRRGDDVRLKATFVNTGSTSLDGTMMIVAQDLLGNTVAEFRHAFAGLAAGASLPFEAFWKAAPLDSQSCQFLVYGQYGGQTTALYVYAAAPGTPLQWESIVFSDGKVQLAWPCDEGKSYTVEFTPELGRIPFSSIKSHVLATPPKNIFVDEARQRQGYYRLREE